MQRLGFFKFDTTKKVIWVHAVSVGEVKAVVPFFEILKQNYPEHFFCFSTTTFTGQQEAKRSITADSYFYLPLDFKWVVRRFVKKIKPELFFLTEGDVWPNLLSSIKKEGGKTILISGKMSERSFARMKRFSWVSRKLYSNLDLICAQSATHAARFSQFKDNVQVTGNLKFDMKKRPLKEILGSYITISCTHASEEEILLDQFLCAGQKMDSWSERDKMELPRPPKPIAEGAIGEEERLFHEVAAAPGVHFLSGTEDQFIKCPWTIFLAPRHPERLREVENLLIQKNISYTRFSERKAGDFQVILMDTMGNLGFCYSKSILAVMGGSFVKGIGGHNLLEPALYGCPTLFGPYMDGQKEIASAVLKANSGLQRDHTSIIKAALEIEQNREDFSQRSLDMIENLRGASDATFQAVLKMISK